MAKALLFIPFSIPLPYIKSWNEKVLTIKSNKLTQNIGRLLIPKRGRNPMEVLDNRGLEPPQPMMRTLRNKDLKNGEQLAMTNDHHPRNVSDSESLDVGPLPIIRVCSHDGNGRDID